MDSIIPTKIEFAAVREQVQSQFRNLNPKDPSTWPALPRYALFVGVVVIVLTALWFSWLNGYDSDLEAARTQEQSLRDDYTKKLAQAVNLDALKKQREQVQQFVTQLEKQLPSKAEIDALLSDINQAGLGRSLQFELFRPGQVVVRDYYAELPISLKVTGRYHDIGAFASDIANLSRIVTLNNLAIAPVKDGAILSMEATAKTFRYLDASEVVAQRKGPASAAAGGGKK
jgi:type IV pilus assembly protein PilO